MLRIELLTGIHDKPLYNFTEALFLFLRYRLKAHHCFGSNSKGARDFPRSQRNSALIFEWKVCPRHKFFVGNMSQSRACLFLLNQTIKHFAEILWHMVSTQKGARETLEMPEKTS